jgi:hypothetical protein
MHKHLLGNGEVVEGARSGSLLFYCCLLPVTVLNVLAVTVFFVLPVTVFYVLPVTVLNVHRCTRVHCVGTQMHARALCWQSRCRMHACSMCCLLPC